jgi:RNA polymerase sigma-70 factor (ECF subfamily)
MSDFQRLYEHHAQDVYRFVLYLSGNATVAEDVTADTFTRVWMARDTLRIETARAYLIAIARNLYLDGRRRSRPIVPLHDSLPDRGPDPHEEMTSRAELGRVLAALQSLPESDRAALLMRAHGDLPYHDIAAALGCSVAAVRVRVHRARLRLAEARAGRRVPAAREECP